VGTDHKPWNNPMISFVVADTLLRLSLRKRGMLPAPQRPSKISSKTSSCGSKNGHNTARETMRCPRVMRSELHQQAEKRAEKRRHQVFMTKLDDASHTPFGGGSAPSQRRGECRMHRTPGCTYYFGSLFSARVSGDGGRHAYRHKVRRHVCYDFSFMGATNPKPIGCRATVVPSIRSWRCRLSPGLSNLVRALATSE
jgi:hypothetical protein